MFELTRKSCMHLLSQLNKALEAKVYESGNQAPSNSPAQEYLIVLTLTNQMRKLNLFNQGLKCVLHHTMLILRVFFDR